MESRVPTLAAAALSLAVVTCAYNPPPTPIGGDEATIGSLAGEWSGTYDSRDLGRSGDIYFRLRAGSDTARGQVFMASRPPLYGDPPSVEDPTAARAAQVPPVVSIRFVGTGGPWVYGELDPYPDPTSGEPLHTTFTGRIDGESIRGQFSTSAPGGAVSGNGTWVVRRTGPPPTDDVDDEARDIVGQDPGVGPDEAEMLALGKTLYTDLGCAFCHEARQADRAPDLARTLPHRSFGWIYLMILDPDSMVRHDPIARDMYQQYQLEMPDRSVTPWEALVLYEYLVAAMMSDPGSN